MALANAASDVRRTVQEVQQDFAEILGHRDRRVMWNLLFAQEADMLRATIVQLIPDREGCQLHVNRLRKTLFEAAWAQRKYTDGISMSAIIFVLVTKEKDFNYASESTEYSIHPVIRTKKCVDQNGDSSAGCCMIFVDETGRVYQNWESFVDENELPAGTMIAPRRGVYNLNNGHILLDLYLTPAGRLPSKVFGFMNSTLSIGAIFAACIPVVMLVVAVPSSLIVLAPLICLTAAIFSILRNGMQLVDRYRHEQTNRLRNRQARNVLLCFFGGLIGLAAAGAANVVQRAVAAGNGVSLVSFWFILVACAEYKLQIFGKVIQVATNGLNISSIVLSGTGTANGVLDLMLKYRDGEKITTWDVLQISASLVLFTHSVRNFHLAEDIIKDAQNGKNIRAFRKSLSRRQRRMFDKMSKNTGSKDIIRGINESRGDTSHNWVASMQAIVGSAYITIDNRLYEHVRDSQRFEEIIQKMLLHFREDSCNFIINLTATFFDSILYELPVSWRNYISTELVLGGIVEFVLKTYDDYSFSFLQEMTSEILEATKKLFTINTASGNTQSRCKHCNGYVKVCKLNL